VEWSTPQAEIAYLYHIIDVQAKELDEQSARLRAAWIEKERLQNLLRANNIDLGTPTPELVPLAGAR
jgi:hypothetical protein